MLQIRYAGFPDAIPTLAAGAFSRQNFGNLPGGRACDRITADTPNGVLGGMVAVISNNDEIDIYAGQGTVKGVFLNNSSDASFENIPAVASGKVTVMQGRGSYKTDIYETVKEAGGAFAAPYAAGDLLYASNFGLLTKEDTGSGVVGVITSAPTVTDPFIGFDLRI